MRTLEDMMPGWLSDCLAGLGDHPLERGVPLTSKENLSGAVQAEVFIASLQVPKDPKSCAELFPRLWFLHASVSHALMFGTPFWEGVDIREALSGVMIGTWDRHGRPMWEAPADGPPMWGG